MLKSFFEDSAQKPILKVKENKNIFRKTFKRIFKDKKSIKNEHEYDNPYATVTEGNSKFFINLSEKSKLHFNFASITIKQLTFFPFFKLKRVELQENTSTMRKTSTLKFLKILLDQRNTMYKN